MALGNSGKTEGSQPNLGASNLDEKWQTRLHDPGNLHTTQWPQMCQRASQVKLPEKPALASPKFQFQWNVRASQPLSELCLEEDPLPPRW